MKMFLSSLSEKNGSLALYSNDNANAFFLFLFVPFLFSQMRMLHPIRLR
jgi:hypothetical protein